MRGVKISLFTAAIIFVNILLFLQCLDAFSKWSTQTRRFKVEKIIDGPTQNLTLFRQPGHKQDYIFCVKDSEPDYHRLYFFSPFHKTQVGPRIRKDIIIPRFFNFVQFQVIDDYNNGEPVLPLLGIENKKIVLELRDIENRILDRIKLENLSIKPPTDIITAKIESIEDIDADGHKDLV